MAEWKSLQLKPDNISRNDLHNNICKAIVAKEGDCLWIAQVDLDVRYKVYDSLEDMCDELWDDWDDVNTFIDEHKIDNNVPAITMEHGRQFYVLRTKELAHEFLRMSIESVRASWNE